MLSHHQQQQPLPSSTNPLSTSPHTTTEILPHMTVDPIHLHYHGPPSPGLQDDYFELSEARLVLKLNNLQTQNNHEHALRLTHVPSLLGPIQGRGGLSRELVSESSSGGGSSMLWQEVSVGSLEAQDYTKGVVKTSAGDGCDWTDDEPTATDWQAEELSRLRTAKTKNVPARRPITPPAKLNMLPQQEERLAELARILRTEEKRLAVSPPAVVPPPPSTPLGREISFQLSLDETDMLAASSTNGPPSAVTSSPMGISDVDPPPSSTSLAPTKPKKLSVRVATIDNTSEMEATNSTTDMSISTTTSSQQQQQLDANVLKMTPALPEEDEEDEDASIDDEVAMHNRVAIASNDYESRLASPPVLQSFHSTNDETELALELDDEFKIMPSPSLEQIRSSSFSSSIDEDTSPISATTNTSNNNGSTMGSSTKKKRLSWHIGILRRRSPKEEWADGAQTTPGSPTSSRHTVRISSPLSMDFSMCDSTMTPSAFQWQEQKSMSSISVSNKSHSVYSSKSSHTSPVGKKKKGKRKWLIGRRSKTKRNDTSSNGGESSSQSMVDRLSPLTLMEEGDDEAFPHTQPITRLQLRIARNTQEKLRLSSPTATPPPTPMTPNTALREENGSPSIAERYNHKNHPRYQNRTTYLQQQQPQRTPQYRGISHESLLSDELFVQLADEQDFDDFIKQNKISIKGDYLLGKMLRERERIQMKRSMLHAEPETYVTVHGSGSTTGGGKSVGGKSMGGNSTRTRDSEDRSVYFAI